jgi:hypothetical protein
MPRYTLAFLLLAHSFVSGAGPAVFAQEPVRGRFDLVSVRTKLSTVLVPVPLGFVPVKPEDYGLPSVDASGSPVLATFLRPSDLERLKAGPDPTLPMARVTQPQSAAGQRVRTSDWSALRQALSSKQSTAAVQRGVESAVERLREDGRQAPAFVTAPRMFFDSDQAIGISMLASFGTEPDNTAEVTGASVFVRVDDQLLVVALWATEPKVIERDVLAWGQAVLAANPQTAWSRLKSAAAGISWARAGMQGLSGAVSALLVTLLLRWRRRRSPPDGPTSIRGDV